MKRKTSRLPLLLPLLLLAAAWTAAPAFGESSVFDQPKNQARHLHLLARMDASYARKDYAAMEKASRDGLALGSADELWAYNLACALALQGKDEAALAALDKAIDAGFLDTDYLVKDPDFATLRGTDGFKARLTRMARLTDHPDRKKSAALAPDASHTVMQTASNTLWRFQAGLFHTLVDLPATNPPVAYRGPEEKTLNAWLREGSAAGTAGLLYVNRDNGTCSLDPAPYPGMVRLAYSSDVTDRKLNIGLPNTLFTQGQTGLLVPVIGNSSMGYMNSPYWRSQPRAICGDPRQVTLQSVFLLGNQLFFYPVYGDYDLQTGDLFPANLPYLIAVAGQTDAERPFLEAAAAALSALRPETRAALLRANLLMPTLSMLFRASQKTLKRREDYLTGIAHPAVFQARDLDTAKLVQMAHALTTNALPPLVLLGVRRETQMIPDRDFFDLSRTEQLFDSPLAVARVFRGAPRTRTLEIQTRCPRTDARLHWVVLRGDPSDVGFTPNPTNASLMTLTVAYQPPYRAPAGDGKSIATFRVDIGVIAEADGEYSLPAIISFCFLGNEQRVYGEDGKIRSIDYTRAQTGYADPLLSVARNWKDVYQYDAQGRFTGWQRLRGGQPEEAFTAYGHLIATRDALGRAHTAHVVRYLPRHIGNSSENEDLPDLAQLDDNVEVTYRYASGEDRVGTPDFTTLTQDFQPPEQADDP